MAYRISTIAQNSICDSLADLVDVGSTNSQGRFLIYTGSQPSSPNVSATGTLLATINFNNPAFGASSGGVAALITSPAVSATISATGTAGWGRIINRATNAVLDVSITATGGGGDITFDSVSFVSGGTVSITSLSLSFPM